MKTWLILLLAFRTLVAFAASPDLTGKVMGDDETAIPNATVFIYTAGPKVGTGALCPSCYADCRKKARTDADGQFKIEALDPKLIFRLLVVAGGHEPAFVTKVDPAKGPREITLKSVAKKVDDGRKTIAGMVISPDGEPVFGTVFSVEGVEQGGGTRWGGVERDADPIAVTDENGLFTLRCSDELKAVHALLEAPGFAKKWVRLVPDTDHLFRLQDGVVVRGQTLSNGKPVQNAVIGMSTVERESGKHMHDFETMTDSEGRFVIRNVPSGLAYYVFGRMETMGDAGAFPVRRVTTGATGSSVDLGKVELAKSHRISGRVVMTDGGVVPPNTRLFLGRDEAWDHTEAVLDQNGRFEFTGIPSESVSLSVRIRGYRFSQKNPSLDWYNGGVIGTIDKDLEDFVMLMEPGEWRYNHAEEDAPAGTDLQPRSLPLRGVKL